MLRKIKEFVKHPTSINVIINTAGTYVNIFFTAFFAFLLFRLLTPSQFGVYSVLLGISYVLSNVLDLGTTATIYSSVPVKINKKEDLFVFVKSIFFYQSIFSAAVILILVMFFPFLDRIFFKTGASMTVFLFTAASTLFFIWQNFLQNCLYAAKQFISTNIYINLANIVKALAVFALIALKIVSVGGIIFVFGIIAPLAFFVFVLIEKKGIVMSFLKAPVSFKELHFGYTLTYFIGSQFYNLTLRSDLFLLSFFRSKAEVGYYAAAQKVILTIYSTMISVTQVLSPLFAKVKSRKELALTIKRGFYYLLIPAGLFLLTIITPNQLYDLFFTKKFAGSTILIVHLLSLPFAITALANLPTVFVIYTLKKPKFMLVSNIIQFLIVVVGCYLFIPKYGVLAPPFVILAASVIGNIYLVIEAFIQYKISDLLH